MPKRKRMITLDDDAAIQIIEEQLQILEKSTDKTLIPDIRNFLSFLDKPNIRHLLASSFSPRLIPIFEKHSQLLFQMEITDWRMELMNKVFPLGELEGLYNTVLGEVDPNQSLDYFFTGLAHGSSLAAINLVYYHLRLLSQEKPAMPLSEYETLIINLLYPLKTPGYILAGQFYYALCSYLYQTTPDHPSISHYMSLAIRALLMAEALLPTSKNQIYNAYGCDFEEALTEDLVFLNEETTFSSIRHYRQYIQENFNNATGLTIDSDSVPKNLELLNNFPLNAIYSLFAEKNSSPEHSEQPDYSSGMTLNRNSP